MEQLINGLVLWLKNLPTGSIYLVFFLVAYFENILPPIPGDLLVAFGGYMAAVSIIALIPVYVLTVVASVFGFMTVFSLGFHWGEQIERHPEKFWLLRFIPLKYIEKAQSWMNRWGQGVVVANRFLAGLRSVISLTAGISKTKIYRTAISSTISSLMWNAILLGLGWVVQKNWQVIGHYLTIYGNIILGAILLFIVVRVGMYVYKKRSSSTARGE